MKTIKLYLSVLAVFTFLRLPAQTLYVHTDKETYLPGEILWFKMYVLDTATFRPLEAVSAGYVDLLDGSGRSVLQGKIHLGAAYSQGGSLFVPQRLHSGSYTLVGSTLSSEQEARNFHKKLTILNPYALVDSLPAARQKKMLFFPEGGTWVQDLPSRLAIKTQDESGKPAPAELYANDKKLGQTNAQGLGLLELIPGTIKRIQARYPDGNTLDLDLPAPASSGLVLQAHRQGDQYQVEIKGSPSFRQSTVVLQYGRGSSKALSLNAAALATFSLSPGELPEGSSLLTVLDAEGKPAAERVLFRKPGNELSIEGKLDKNILKEQEQVSLSLQGLNLSAWADLSLSVRKVDSLNGESKQNIRSYLYLGQHLKGRIEDEAFYLEKASSEDLELLLLSQGWRRFKKATAAAEGRYQQIRIRFTKKTDGQVLAGQVAYLSVPDRSAQLYYAQTDEEGIATFAIKTLYGNKNIAVRLQSGESANMELLRHAPSPAEPEFNLPYGGKMPTQSYTEQGISVQVQNVFSGKERASFLPAPAADSLSFYGKADVRYLLDDYTRFVVMEEVLREYIKEVNVRKSKEEFNLRTLDVARGNFLSEDPLLLLDGIPLRSANEIMNYDPLKVKQIEVVAGKYYLGQDTFDGIVSFSTYKGNLENFQLDPGTAVFAYEGIQVEREFYVPQASPGLPDQRDVLLWIPKLSLKENQVQKIDLHTSERKGRYLIDVQGVDKAGKSGYLKLYFEVK